MVHSWPRKLALGWLAALALAAALAPVLPLPYPPALPDLAHLVTPPAAATRHWLGTDPQGRDVLAALLFGARTVLGLALPATLLATLFGAAAGGAAGFWGNTGLRLARPWWLAALGGAWWWLALPPAWLGLIILALSSIWMLVARRQLLPTWPVPLDALVLGGSALLGTVPRLVLVVALAAGTVWTPDRLLGLLLLVAWPDTARLVRAQMLRVRALPFVTAGHALGLAPGRLWWHHALPAAVAPVRATLPLTMAGLVGLESTLSFLGIGLPPDVSSWGRLLNGLRSAPQAWWLAIFPGLALTFSILSLHVLAQKNRK